MAKSIQISKRGVVEVLDISSYRMVVETLNANEMPDKIFIKQRVRNFAKESFEDTFVAICTPSQLEDLQEDSPEDGTSYYRTNRIELVARTAELLNDVFESLLFEVKKLVIDLTDLEALAPAVIYNINAIDPVTIE